MSRSIRRITLLVAVALLVSHPGTAATAAVHPTAAEAVAEPTTLSGSVGDDAVPALPDDFGGFVTETTLRSEVVRTLNTGGDLTQTVIETSLGTTASGLFAAGYTYRSDSVALDHDTRQALYEAVRESPGESLSDVASLLGLSLPTTRYHTRILEKHGIVAVETGDDDYRLFPVEGSSRQEIDDAGFR